MPIIRKRRTLSIMRLLTALGPLRQRRRIPKQKQPDRLRREYLGAITPFVRTATAEFDKVRGEVVALLELERERREQGVKQDASNKDRAKQLVERAAVRAAAAWAPRELYAAASRYAKRTNDFQKEQLGRQVSAAMGVSLAAIEPTITVKIEEFAARNVDLIKTVPERYFDRLRLDVEEAFDTGMHPSTLAEIFEERDGMAENDARRIARDQIGKLNGQLNEARQTGMGVTGYTWRTANDNRVRDEHADREGQHYEWSDPPEDGHPGEAIQCRCFAEPDLGPILEGLDPV